MAKKIKLFAIYCKQGKDAIAKTSVAFTSEKEAAKYCEYINNTEINTNMVFFWREESLVIYKNARTLIDDENEDSILFC